MFRFRHFFSVLLLAVLTLSGCRSSGEFGSEPEQLVEKSRITFKSMMSDNQYPGLVDLASRAKAIVIIPNLGKAAFLVGGRMGNAVMLVRDAQNSWSNPAVYTLSGPSIGLQLGVSSSEIVITVMTDRGVNALLDRQVTLGGDAGLAIGELGKGVNAATGIGLKSDMYAFARSEGLYVGVSLEGSVLAPRHTWNRELYGGNPKPRDIMVSRSVSSSSPAVSSLIQAMP